MPAAPAPVLSSPVGGLAARLAQLARSGDAPAWEAVCALALPWMQRVSQGLLRDLSLADDAVQEALLALRAHAGAFRPRPDPGADADAQALRWIVRLTANCARMVRRAEQRAQRRGRSRPAEARIGTTSEDGLDATEAEAVRAAVDALPERERAAVVLHILARLPYEQVALELECPIGSAKTWVHRGLGRLRRTLRARGLTEAAAVAALQAPPLPHGAPSPLAHLLAHAAHAPSAAILPTAYSGALMASLPLVLTAAATLVVGVGSTIHLRAQDAPPVPAAVTPHAAQPATAADPQAMLCAALDRIVHVDFKETDLVDAALMLSQLTHVPMRVDAQPPSPVTYGTKGSPVRCVLDLLAASSGTVVVGVSPVRFVTPDARKLARDLDQPCALTLRGASWTQTLVALWAKDVPVIDCTPSAAASWAVDVAPAAGATVRTVLDQIAQAHGQHWQAVDGRILFGDGPIGTTSTARTAAIKDQLSQELHVEFQGTDFPSVVDFLQKVSNTTIVLDPSLSQNAITLTMDHTKFWQVLAWTAATTHAQLALRSGAIVIAPAGSSLRPRAAPCGITELGPLVAPATASTTASAPRSF